jgi:uncharacterized damage-inducible protein DinB
MSIDSQFQTLFAYQWHTTLKLMESAARLSDADYKANPGYGHGSIHDLFFHILRTGRSWRIALETGRQQSGISAAEYPDLASLRNGFAQEQAAWSALLDTLSPDKIAGDIELITWRGDKHTFALWRVLQHLVLHSMQHHTEIAQLLTAKGQSPGDLDFIFYSGQ